MMLLERLDQISEQSLQRLCETSCPESTTLDFKRELPNSSERDRVEFLKDVCALANADGGDLVYGIDENDAGASALVALSNEPADAATRRLLQVLDAGLEPRLNGHRLRVVEVTGGYVVVLRVPASHDGPHCLRINGNLRRFTTRNGTTTSDMSFDQLRGAFGRTQTLCDRARAFVAERLRLIDNDMGAKPLVPEPKGVLHVLPLSGLGGRAQIDMREVYNSGFAQFMGPDWMGCNRTFNFEGVVAHPGRSDEGAPAYAQVNRTGTVETVSVVGGMWNDRGQPPRKIIWGSEVVKCFRGSLQRSLAAYRGWQVEGPAIVSVAVVHMEGHSLSTEGHFHSLSNPTTKTLVALPELWVEDISSVDVDALLRPHMDIFFQGFQYEFCAYFDQATGAYIGRP